MKRWRGLGRRRKTPKGYVVVWRRGRYVKLHRLVMEKILGRKLRRNEVVHHRNGKVADNRPANLVVMKKRQHDAMRRKRRWFDV